MEYRGVGRAGQQFEESLLIVRFDGEDVDQRDQFAAQGDRCHRRIPTMWLLQGQPLSALESGSLPFTARESTPEPWPRELHRFETPEYRVFAAARAGAT